ncbi:M3 family metallopeptidase [Nocardia sp. NPDC005745]|uniref:M3 family metallopeptidase n=1 Tax=Nocardia sp. NPDC005745 TaxID=3157061 RepID=UPI0033E2DF15
MVQIPDYFPDWLTAMVLGHFPEGDPEAMRRSADTWSDAANGLVLVLHRLVPTVEQLEKAVEGETGTEVQKQYRKIIDQIQAQIEFNNAMARQLYDNATAIEYQQYVIIGIAGALLAQVIIDMAMPPPGSIVKAIADRAEARAGMELAKRDLVLTMLTRAARFVTEHPRLVLASKGVFFGTAIGGGVPYVAQRVQIAQGHRKAVDWQQVEIGAAAGAVGGLVGVEVGRRVAPAAMRAGGRVLGTVAAGGVGGMAGGLAGGLTAFALTKGELRGKDLATMVWTGFGSGLVGSLGASVRAARAGAYTGVPEPVASADSGPPSDAAPSVRISAPGDGQPPQTQTATPEPVSTTSEVDAPQARRPGPEFGDGSMDRPDDLTPEMMAEGDQILRDMVDDALARIMGGDGPGQLPDGSGGTTPGIAPDYPSGGSSHPSSRGGGTGWPAWDTAQPARGGVAVAAHPEGGPVTPLPARQFQISDPQVRPDQQGINVITEGAVTQPDIAPGTEVLFGDGSSAYAPIVIEHGPAGEMYLLAPEQTAGYDMTGPRPSGESLDEGASTHEAHPVHKVDFDAEIAALEAELAQTSPPASADTTAPSVQAPMQAVDAPPAPAAHTATDDLIAGHAQIPDAPPAVSAGTDTPIPGAQGSAAIPKADPAQAGYASATAEPRNPVVPSNATNSATPSAAAPAAAGGTSHTGGPKPPLGPTPPSGSQSTGPLAGPAPGAHGPAAHTNAPTTSASAIPPTSSTSPPPIAAAVRPGTDDEPDADPEEFPTPPGTVVDDPREHNVQKDPREHSVQQDPRDHNVQKKPAGDYVTIPGVSYPLEDEPPADAIPVIPHTPALTPLPNDSVGLGRAFQNPDDSGNTPYPTSPRPPDISNPLSDRHSAAPETNLDAGLGKTPDSLAMPSRYAIEPNSETPGAPQKPAAPQLNPHSLEYSEDPSRLPAIGGVPHLSPAPQPKKREGKRLVARMGAEPEDKPKRRKKQPPPPPPPPPEDVTKTPIPVPTPGVRSDAKDSDNRSSRPADPNQPGQVKTHETAGPPRDFTRIRDGITAAYRQTEGAGELHPVSQALARMEPLDLAILSELSPLVRRRVIDVVSAVEKGQELSPLQGDAIKTFVRSLPMEPLDSTGTLTDLELTELRLVAEDKSLREIGVLIGLKETTVRAHLVRIERKLGAEDRVTAVVAAIRKNILPQTLHEPADRARSPLPDLTPRETEVLALVAEGKSSPEIATQLDISVAAVDSLVERAGEKLGSPTRAGMVAVAVSTDVLPRTTQGGDSGQALPELTQREIEVLTLIAKGKTSAEIADDLALTPQTVESYASRINRKLGVGTRAGSVAIVIRTGIIPPIDATASDGAARPELTPREREVLGLVAKGENDNEIAAALGLTRQSAKTYVFNINQKFGTHHRAGMAAFALRTGNLPLMDAAPVAGAEKTGSGGSPSGRRRTRPHGAVDSYYDADPAAALGLSPSGSPRTTASHVPRDVPRWAMGFNRNPDTGEEWGDASGQGGLGDTPGPTPWQQSTTSDPGIAPPPPGIARNDAPTSPPKVATPRTRAQSDPVQEAPDTPALVRAARNGDSVAFDRLRADLADPIVQWMSARMAGDRAAAEGLTEEVFARAAAGIGRLRAEQDIEQWLGVIARNVLVEHRRYERLRDGIWASYAGPRNTASGPQGGLLARADRATVLRAVHQLPSDHRKVLVWRFEQDKTATQIAESMPSAWGSRAVRRVERRAAQRVVEMVAAELGVVVGGQSAQRQQQWRLIQDADPVELERHIHMLPERQREVAGLLLPGGAKAVGTSPRRLKDTLYQQVVPALATLLAGGVVLTDHEAVMLTRAAQRHDPAVLAPYAPGLDPLHQKTFEQFFMQRRTVNEMAAAEGSKPKTIYMRVYRVARFMAQKVPRELRESYTNRGLLQSATTHDVAREAGVSQSTTEKVLRGAGEFAPETKRRVLEAADRLGHTFVQREGVAPPLRVVGPAEQYRYLGGDAGYRMTRYEAHVLFESAVRSGTPTVGDFTVRIPDASTADGRPLFPEHQLWQMMPPHVQRFRKVLHLLSDVRLPDGRILDSSTPVLIEQRPLGAVPTDFQFDRLRAMVLRSMEGLRRALGEVPVEPLRQWLPGFPEDRDTEGFLRFLTGKWTGQVSRYRQAGWAEMFTDLEIPGRDPFAAILEQAIFMIPARFEVLHGRLGRENIRIDRGRITAITGWAGALIGDPAFDWAWLNHRGTGDYVPPRLRPPNMPIYESLLHVRRVVHGAVELVAQGEPDPNRIAEYAASYAIVRRFWGLPARNPGLLRDIFEAQRRRLAAETAARTEPRTGQPENPEGAGRQTPWSGGAPSAQPKAEPLVRGTSGRPTPWQRTAPSPWAPERQSVPTAGTASPDALPGPVRRPAQLTAPIGAVSPRDSDEPVDSTNRDIEATNAVDSPCAVGAFADAWKIGFDVRQPVDVDGPVPAAAVSWLAGAHHRRFDDGLGEVAQFMTDLGPGAGMLVNVRPVGAAIGHLFLLHNDGKHIWIHDRQAAKPKAVFDPGNLPFAVATTHALVLTRRGSGNTLESRQQQLGEDIAPADPDMARGRALRPVDAGALPPEGHIDEPSAATPISRGRPSDATLELMHRYLDAVEAADGQAQELLVEVEQHIPDTGERAYIQRFAENERRAAALAEELGIPLDRLRTLMAEELRKLFDGEIVTRATSGSLRGVLESGRFKTGFDFAGRSRMGHSLLAGRVALEQALFGYPPDLPTQSRPIYGFIRTAPSYRVTEGDALAQYGDVDIVFKSTVEERTTANVGDTKSVVAIPSRVTDPQPESFAATPRGHKTLGYIGLEGIDRDYTGKRFTGNTYIEAQVHGATVADIDYVVFHTSPPDQHLRELLDAAGIPWSHFFRNPSKPSRAVQAAGRTRTAAPEAKAPEPEDSADPREGSEPRQATRNVGLIGHASVPPWNDIGGADAFSDGGPSALETPRRMRKRLRELGELHIDGGGWVSGGGQRRHSRMDPDEAAVAAIRDLPADRGGLNPDLTVEFVPLYAPDGLRTEEDLEAVATAVADMMRERGWRDRSQIEAATELVRSAGRNAMTYMERYTRSVQRRGVEWYEEQTAVQDMKARLTLRMSTQADARSLYVSFDVDQYRPERSPDIEMFTWHAPLFSHAEIGAELRGLLDSATVSGVEQWGEVWARFDEPRSEPSGDSVVEPPPGGDLEAKARIVRKLFDDHRIRFSGWEDSVVPVQAVESVDRALRDLIAEYGGRFALRYFRFDDEIEGFGLTQSFGTTAPDTKDYYVTVTLNSKILTDPEFARAWAEQTADHRWAGSTEDMIYQLTHHEFIHVVADEGNWVLHHLAPAMLRAAYELYRELDLIAADVGYTEWLALLPHYSLLTFTDPVTNTFDPVEGVAEGARAGAVDSSLPLTHPARVLHWLTVTRDGSSPAEFLARWAQRQASGDPDISLLLQDFRDVTGRDDIATPPLLRPGDTTADVLVAATGGQPQHFADAAEIEARLRLWDESSGNRGDGVSALVVPPEQDPYLLVRRASPDGTTRIELRSPVDGVLRANHVPSTRLPRPSGALGMFFDETGAAITVSLGHDGPPRDGQPDSHEPRTPAPSREGAAETATQHEQERRDGIASLRPDAASEPGLVVQAIPHVELTAALASYGDTGDGWTGADGTYSRRLPDGRHLWMFSDTFLGTVHPDGSRPATSPMVKNTFVVDDQGRMSTVHGGTADAPTSVVPSPKGQMLWVGGGYVTGNVLNVMLVRFVNNDPDDLMWGLTWDENVLARFDADDLGLIDLTPMPSQAGVMWSAWLDYDGTHTYVYGTEESGNDKFMHVARVSGDDLRARWEFFDGEGWTSNENDSARIMPGVANEYSVTRWRDRYLLITQDTSAPFSAEIWAYLSDSPTGPFTSPTLVYRAPEAGATGSFGDPNVYAYNAHEHPDLRSGDTLVISYNVNSLDFEGVVGDVSKYRPRFVTVRLNPTFGSSCADATEHTPEPDAPDGLDPATNPVLAAVLNPAGDPAFDRMEAEHFPPVFELAMRVQLAAIDDITGTPGPWTADNALRPFVRSGLLLGAVKQLFAQKAAVDRDSATAEAEPALAELQDAHASRILTDSALAWIFQYLHEHRGDLDLSYAELGYLERKYKDFQNAGAYLSTDLEKHRLSELNSEVAVLQTAYKDNQERALEDVEIRVDDADELRGLTGDQIESARSRAGEDGGYVLPKPPAISGIWHPYLTYLDDPALRRRIYEEVAGLAIVDHDNSQNVLDQVRRWAERAEMTGHNNHAEYVMASGIFDSIPIVKNILDRIARAAATAARVDFPLLAEAIGAETIQPWDRNRALDVLISRRVGIDEQRIREFFELDLVLDKGVFRVAKDLFELTITEVDEDSKPPVWHEDVRVFAVLDKEGEHLTNFYFDPYARAGKNGGEWTDPIRLKFTPNGQSPLISVHLNLEKPPTGRPTLLAPNEVDTLFHEFGHALHFLLGEGTHEPAKRHLVFAWIEFVAKVFQQFWKHPDVVANYAVHHQTGEPMPPEMLEKLDEWRTAYRGAVTIFRLAGAYVDLAWSSLPSAQVPQGDDPRAIVQEFEKTVLTEAGIYFPEMKNPYPSQWFRHLFAQMGAFGTYSGQYWSYLLSDVLALIVFGVRINPSIEQHGRLTPETGKLILDEILRYEEDNLEQATRRLIGSQPAVEYFLMDQRLLWPEALLELGADATPQWLNTPAERPPGTDLESWWNDRLTPTLRAAMIQAFPAEVLAMDIALSPETVAAAEQRRRTLLEYSRDAPAATAPPAARTTASDPDATRGRHEARDQPGDRTAAEESVRTAIEEAAPQWPTAARTAASEMAAAVVADAARHGAARTAVVAPHADVLRVTVEHEGAAELSPELVRTLETGATSWRAESSDTTGRVLFEFHLRGVPERGGADPADDPVVGSQVVRVGPMDDASAAVRASAFIMISPDIRYWNHIGPAVNEAAALAETLVREVGRGGRAVTATATITRSGRWALDVVEENAGTPRFGRAVFRPSEYRPASNNVAEVLERAVPLSETRRASEPEAVPARRDAVADTAGADPLRLLTWNIAGARRSRSAEAFDYVDDLPSFVRVLSEIGANVAFLQESEVGPDGSNARQLAEMHGYQYVYETVMCPSHMDTTKAISLAVLSDRPIESAVDVLLPATGVELTLGGRALEPDEQFDRYAQAVRIAGTWFVNLHPTPLGFFGRSYEEHQDVEGAAHARAIEQLLHSLADGLRSLADGPIVLLGDFNTDDPGSVYRALIGELDLTAALDPATETVPWGSAPDQVMTSAEIRTTRGYIVVTETDHYPVVVDLSEATPDSPPSSAVRASAVADAHPAGPRSPKATNHPETTSRQPHSTAQQIIPFDSHRVSGTGPAGMALDIPERKAWDLGTVPPPRGRFDPGMVHAVDPRLGPDAWAVGQRPQRPLDAREPAGNASGGQPAARPTPGDDIGTTDHDENRSRPGQPGAREHTGGGGIRITPAGLIVPADPTNSLIVPAPHVLPADPSLEELMERLRPWKEIFPYFWQFPMPREGEPSGREWIESSERRAWMRRRAILRTPLYAGVDAAVRLTLGAERLLAAPNSSPGPATLRQRRVIPGRGEIDAEKKRTLRADAQVRESNRADLVEMTVFERFWRAVSGDEIPQTKQIRRGEMAYVGGRLLRAEGHNLMVAGRYAEDYELMVAGRDPVLTPEEYALWLMFSHDALWTVHYPGCRELESQSPEFLLTRYLTVAIFDKIASKPLEVQYLNDVVRPYLRRQGAAAGRVLLHELSHHLLDSCRSTLEQLGMRARKGSGTKVEAEVEEHLDNCAACRTSAAALPGASSLGGRELVEQPLHVTEPAQTATTGLGDSVESDPDESVFVVTFEVVLSEYPALRELLPEREYRHLGGDEGEVMPSEIARSLHEAGVRYGGKHSGAQKEVYLIGDYAVLVPKPSHTSLDFVLWPDEYQTLRAIAEVALPGERLPVPQVLHVERNAEGQVMFAIQRRIHGEPVDSVFSKELAPAMSTLMDLFRRIEVQRDSRPVRKGSLRLPADYPESGDSVGFFRMMMKYLERVYRHYRELEPYRVAFDELRLSESLVESLGEMVGELRSQPFCVLHADITTANVLWTADGGMIVDLGLALYGPPDYEAAVAMHRDPGEMERDRIPIHLLPYFGLLDVMRVLLDTIRLVDEATSPDPDADRIGKMAGSVAFALGWPHQLQHGDTQPLPTYVQIRDFADRLVQQTAARSGTSASTDTDPEQTLSVVGEPDEPVYVVTEPDEPSPTTAPDNHAPAPHDEREPHDASEPQQSPSARVSSADEQRHTDWLQPGSGSLPARPVDQAQDGPGITLRAQAIRASADPQAAFDGAVALDLPPQRARGLDGLVLDPRAAVSDPFGGVRRGLPHGVLAHAANADDPHGGAFGGGRSEAERIANAALSTFQVGATFDHLRNWAARLSDDTLQHLLTGFTHRVAGQLAAIHRGKPPSVTDRVIDPARLLGAIVTEAAGRFGDSVPTTSPTTYRELFALGSWLRANRSTVADLQAGMTAVLDAAFAVARTTTEHRWSVDAMHHTVPAHLQEIAHRIEEAGRHRIWLEEDAFPTDGALDAEHVRLVGSVVLDGPTLVRMVGEWADVMNTLLQRRSGEKFSPRYTAIFESLPVHALALDRARTGSDRLFAATAATALPHLLDAAFYLLPTSNSALGLDYLRQADDLLTEATTRFANHIVIYSLQDAADNVHKLYEDIVAAQSRRPPEIRARRTHDALSDFYGVGSESPLHRSFLWGVRALWGLGSQSPGIEYATREHRLNPVLPWDWDITDDERALAATAADLLHSVRGPEAGISSLLRHSGSRDLFEDTWDSVSKNMRWWNKLRRWTSGTTPIGSLLAGATDFSVSQMQLAVLRQYPHIIGAAAGIEYRARDLANRLSLARDLESPEITPERRLELATLRDQLAEVRRGAFGLAIPGSGPPPVLLISYDPISEGGTGGAVVSIGEADSASFVAFNVTGTDTLLTDLSNWAVRACRQYEEAQQHAPRDARVAIMFTVGIPRGIGAPPHAAGPDASGIDNVVAARDVAGEIVARELLAYDATRELALDDSDESWSRMVRLSTAIGHGDGVGVLRAAAQTLWLSRAVDQIVLVPRSAGDPLPTAGQLDMGTEHVYTLNPHRDRNGDPNTVALIVLGHGADIESAPDASSRSSAPLVETPTTIRDLSQLLSAHEYRPLGGSRGIVMTHDEGLTVYRAAQPLLRDALSGTYNTTVLLEDLGLVLRIGQPDTGSYDPRFGPEHSTLPVISRYVRNAPQLLRVITGQMPDGRVIDESAPILVERLARGDNLTETFRRADRKTIRFRQGLILRAFANIHEQLRTMPEDHPLLVQLTPPGVAKGDTGGWYLNHIDWYTKNFYLRHYARFGHLFDEFGLLRGNPFEPLIDEARTMRESRHHILHADPNAGNFLISNELHVTLLDWELAVTGPSAYDWARLGHLIPGIEVPRELGGPDMGAFARLEKFKRVMNDTVKLAPLAAAGQLTPPLIEFIDTEFSEAVIQMRQLSGHTDLLPPRAELEILRSWRP